MFMLRCLFLLPFIECVNLQGDLHISLADGDVQGFYKTSYNNRKYSAFEGIPYAAPPTGNKRFTDPQPVVKWNGTLVANVTYTCIQLDDLSIKGTEDCLYINIYVPREKIDPSEKLDVIVHIHGGAFMIGSGKFNAGPSKILDRDVVFINFNYRLGPLGFIATVDGTFAGNYGLKDQRAALKWLQENVSKFGGNPNSVTITGVSAGAASVHLHYFTHNPKEKLFHRGWAISGTALNPWVVRSTTRETSNNLITKLGCNNQSMDGSVLQCMRQILAEDIINAVEGLYLDRLSYLPISPFGPVVEEETETNQYPFLTEHPLDMLKLGRALDRSLIISQATNEGSLPSHFYYNRMDKLNEQWNKLAPLILEYSDVDLEQQHRISEKIKEKYFKNVSWSCESFDIFTKLCTERLFHLGAEVSAKMHVKFSSNNMYFMLFNYSGDDAEIKESSGLTSIGGTVHGYEAKFIYDIGFFKNNSLNREEESMKDILLDLLSSFAATGVPTAKGVQWGSLNNKNQLEYLFIEGPDATHMESVKHLGDYEFWKNLGL